MLQRRRLGLQTLLQPQLQVKLHLELQELLELQERLELLGLLEPLQLQEEQLVQLELLQLLELLELVLSQQGPVSSCGHGAGAWPCQHWCRARPRRARRFG